MAASASNSLELGHKLSSPLEDQVVEAEQANWLGEVEGLKIGLTGPQTKSDQMPRQDRVRAVDLGFRTLRGPRSGADR